MKNDIYIIRKRRWFIVIPMVITLLMLIPLRSARINADLMKYLPDDIPSKIKIDQLEQVFGKFDPVVLLIGSDDVLSDETLNRCEHLSQAFAQTGAFKTVISLFSTKYIRGEGGMMLVDPVIKQLPQSESEREILRREIKDNPLAYRLLVSDDFKYTLMLLNPEGSLPDKKLFELIHNQLAEFSGNETVFLSGLPVLRYEIQRTAIRDLAILMPIGLLVMMFFLYFSFRERKAVLLPFSVVVMSIVVAMGLMPLLGYDLSLIAVLVPILMIAIANNYGVHLLARYQELNAQNPRWGMKRIVNESVRKLYLPIILTGLTTIVGVLGMVTQVMLPAKQMGWVSAVGILFALVVSLLFIPAVMSGVKKGDLLKTMKTRQNGRLDTLLHSTGRFCTRRPWWVIMIFTGLIVISGAGLMRLQVNINLDEMLPRQHDLRQSAAIMNHSFGGTKTVSLLFAGDIKSPGVMSEIDRAETRLKAILGVGNATSIASVVRLVSKALHNPGDPDYDRIPDQREALAQYIEFYSMSGDPEDLERLVDFGYTRAILTLQFKAVDYASFKSIERQIEALVKESPSCTLVAGQCLIEKELSEAIVKGQINSLLFALGAIIILLWMIFRSLKAGLAGSIPLIVSLLCNFGLMGWAGIRLDIATSLLSSIAIGIGVDYSIHLFWRLKQELAHDPDWNHAIVATLRTTGRGIAINAFSVMLGFSVLFFSGLIILKAFAILIIFSLLLCLLCALVLIPALFSLTQPHFLTNHKSQKL